MLPGKQITAGGGVLFKTEGEQLFVVLIHKRGVWDLPKGKRENNETIEQCALREVAEEVGCPPPVSRGKLTETYHEYTEDGQKTGKTTHWYVMKTEPGVTFNPEEKEGIDRAEWFSIETARRKVGYENLETVLKRFEKWSDSGS